MSDFYLTLPSNSEPSTNTTAKFSVYLPYKIDLPGKWEVALVEIQYPFSWNNLTGRISTGDITDNWIEVTLPSGYRTVIYVPPGYYETVEQLINAIEYGKHEVASQLKHIAISERKEAAEVWNKEGVVKDKKLLAKYEKLYTLKEYSKALSYGFYVTFNSTVKRARVKKDPAQVERICFSTRLQYMLGFQKGEITENEFLGQYIPDLRGGFYSLYVYCSLVEPQIVGNTTAPLLRLVNIEGRHGSICEKTFNSPHYLPIVTKEITKIDIAIKDDNAQFVPFDFGKAIVKLHIRKRKPLL